MSKALRRKEVFFYGNIKFERAICPLCGEEALVKKHVTLCCGAGIAFDADETPIAKRMSETEGKRKPRTAEQERKILRRQGFRCLYCGSELGTWKKRNGEPVYLKTHFDHKLPFVTSHNNYPYNYAAACHVCNGIKSDLVFVTLQDAREYIKYHRMLNGYSF